MPETHIQIPNSLRIWMNKRRLKEATILKSSKYDMLVEAALLEHLVRENKMSLESARYKFLESYPQSNRLCTHLSVLYLVSDKSGEELNNNPAFC